MPTLLDAYKATYPRMKPQVQGTCGIYSFWYATLLLRHLDPSGHPEVPLPRADHHNGGRKGTSMRSFAKHTISSAQGELLTAPEIVTLVEHFGYAATAYQRLKHIWSGREGFITEHLKANRPILFSYLMGNPAPVTKATATTGDNPGPHWSLLVAETADTYKYIEPNLPNLPGKFSASGCVQQYLREYPKAQVLASNAKVDEIKFDRYWAKFFSGNLTKIGSSPAIGFPKATAEVRTAEYDLGDRAANQSLNNVLIAIG